MKRAAVAIVLFAFAVGIALWSGHLFDTRLNYFENQLSQLLVSSEFQLPEKTEKLAEDWERYADFLHSVFIHDGIDELEILITSLPMTLEYSGSEELYSKCIEGINIIKNLKSCEKLTFENVL